MLLLLPVGRFCGLGCPLWMDACYDLWLFVSGWLSGWVVVLVWVVYFGLVRIDVFYGGCGFNNVVFS